MNELPISNHILEKLRARTELLRSSVKPPSIVSLELKDFINYILAPDDMPGDGGILRPRMVHKQLAMFLQAQPMFATLGVIQDLGNDEYRLWRFSEWRDRKEVYDAERNAEREETLKRISAREGFARAMRYIVARYPNFKSNKKLCEDFLLMWVRDAENGDENSIEFLRKLDYYDDEEE